MTSSPENRAAFAFDSTPIELPADLQESWHVLDFEIQQQERTKWCWAAVAASVARYYDPLSTFTQCSIPAPNSCRIVTAAVASRIPTRAMCMAT